MYPTVPQQITPGYTAQPGYQPPPVHPAPQPPFVTVNQNNSDGRTVVVRRGVNHALHLVLTGLTCGMWLPVRLIVWVIENSRN